RSRTVAIERRPPRLSADRESLSRSTREARSASALNHPNIVTIHEVGTDAGTPYIVMEHIEGTDLRTLLRSGPPPNRRSLNIAAQIADGLAAAHEKGIVHRDLKPENVMVTKDGFVKILDFGLAKLIAPAEDDADTVHWEIPATNPGTIVGTVGYMSPEQAHGRPLDFPNIHDAFASTIAADEIPRPPLVKRRTLMAVALIAAILSVGGAGILVLYKRTVPVQEAAVPAKKYIAVTQFIDRTGDPNGQ